MYTSLLILHSLFRWLVLLSLLTAILTAYNGFRSERPFSKTDNAIRHWTATIAHVQLMIGFVLYFISPLVKFFLSHTSMAMRQKEFTFFGIVHIALMLIAVVAITIGSALAKRRVLDRDKFKTMGIWFAAALVIIFAAIPWPFSPLAGRPMLRF